MTGHYSATWLRSVGIEPEGPLAVPSEADPLPPLLALALQGVAGPDGERHWDAADEDQARTRFVQLARQLAELRAEPLGLRGLRGQTRFRRGAIELRREGRRLSLRITPE